jgi:hypothetical protein
MTALATEMTTTANAVANGPAASQVFHVEHRCGRTGHRVELARYTVGGREQRILSGQRVDGVVRVTDVPAHGSGRAYSSRLGGRRGTLRSCDLVRGGATTSRMDGYLTSRVE